MIKKKYIVLPINDSAPAKRYYLMSDGIMISDFTASVDSENKVFDAYIDVSRFGENALSLADSDGNEIMFATADNIPEIDNIPNGDYLRPAAHFTTKLGWTNDPNGLVKIGDRYHMFYQHNPCGWNWGNMTWGHASSDDLMHWTEEGDTLFPDSMGTMFSGSAVIDEKNVSGLGKKAILLFYTAAGGTSELSKDQPFTQCLAYSTNGGKSFTKYEKNPIIPHIIGSNRDPKVQWCEEIGKYTLSLYLDGNEYAVFSSENLLDWEKIADIHMPLDNECPDFYPLKLEEDTKWVFSGAHDSYLIGEFKNGKFEIIQEPRQYHLGRGCSYAAQTFSGTGDRRIKIAWGQNTAPGAVFNSQMGIPTEMFLKETDDGIRLGSYPVREIDKIKKSSTKITGSGSLKFTSDALKDSAVDINIDIPDDCEDFSISCFGIAVKISPKENSISFGENRIPLSYDDEKKIRVIFDTLGAEIFADGGLVYSTIYQIADRSQGCIIRSGITKDIKINIMTLNNKKEFFSEKY